MTQPQPHGRRAEEDRPGPQQHIAALRTGLLGGRGPGASGTELEAHQHQRVVLGGLPVTVAREQVALVTAQARAGRVDEAQAHAARRLAQLVATAPPRQQRHRRTGATSAFALGALLGFATARLRQREQR